MCGVYMRLRVCVCTFVQVCEIWRVYVLVCACVHVGVCVRVRLYASVCVCASVNVHVCLCV